MTPTAFLVNPSLFVVVGLLLYFQYIFPRYTICVGLNVGYVVVADVSIDCLFLEGCLYLLFFFFLETTFYKQKKILDNLMDNLQGFEKHSWKWYYHLYIKIFSNLFINQRRILNLNIIHGNSFDLTWQHLLKMAK